MATTAHAIPSLEVSATEDMDLHSDNGIDFGDGDIDLDLEPDPAASRDDDDVSIQDAASISGLEAHTAPVEQDDFMADHEDLIEEDFDYEGKDDGVVTEQASDHEASLTQEQTDVPIDEDLIDYSDDEGHDPRKHEAVSLRIEGAEAQNDEVENNDFVIQQDEVLDAAAAFNATDNDDVDQRSYHSHSQSPTDHATTVAQTQDPIQSPPREIQEPDDFDKEDEHEDDHDGAIELHDPEVATEPEDSDHNDYHNEARDESSHNVTTDDSKHEEQILSKAKPVTVNYAGNELWLFKEHDPDDSGDWLLDDIALAKSPISELFQACRSSLGDDVSHEHEIGFRFDHLHNLELYEDNTACVAVSLERLVDLYHTLQTQDDNHEPESFYMSLLFRPRFATLLSDIAKYAEQGSGYSALNVAVAAGETHFTNVFSGASTDEPTEWGNEESDEADDDDDESNKESADDGVQEVEHEDEIEPYGHGSEDEHSQEEEPQDHVESHEPVFHEEQNIAPIENVSWTEATDTEHAQSLHQDAASESDGHTPETEAQREQNERDLFDFGDEEAPEYAADERNTPSKDHSSLSSTIQGDEVTETRGATLSTDYIDVSLGQDDHHDNFDFEPEAGHEEQAKDKDTQDGGDTTQSYQDHIHYDDPNDPFQGYEADTTAAFATEEPYDGDANQDFAALDYRDIDQGQHADFMSGAEFNEVENFSTTADNFTDASELLDLDSAATWVVDQGPASGLPENGALEHDVTDVFESDEDGVAGSPALAVSSAANPATVSSAEPKDVSPQGHKRTVDEAGHGADDALDLTGTLQRSPASNFEWSTDHYLSDAKRPRV